MNYVKRFIVILAGAITAHYICKYLDKVIGEKADA